MGKPEAQTKKLAQGHTASRWASWDLNPEPPGFPGGSDGKASACNAGNLGLIPGSGRSPGEGNGNPLQYSCLENPMDRGTLVGYSSWGLKELDMTKRLHFLFFLSSGSSTMLSAMLTPILKGCHTPLSITQVPSSHSSSQRKLIPHSFSSSIESLEICGVRRKMKRGGVCADTMRSPSYSSSPTHMVACHWTLHLRRPQSCPPKVQAEKRSVLGDHINSSEGYMLRDQTTGPTDLW